AKQDGCRHGEFEITATAHKLARVLYNLMRYGVAYAKQTEAAYTEQVRERLEKQLRRRAKELGFELKPITPPDERGGAGESSRLDLPSQADWRLVQWERSCGQ